MKVGIITQPLIGNYGGALQLFALQFVLKKMNVHSVLIDFLPKGQSKFRYVLSCIKTFFLLFSPRNRRSFCKRILNNRITCIEDFLNKYINKTDIVEDYSDKIINEYNLEVIIVGSDQVWRPKLNKSIKNMFLSFCCEKKIKRIAYAASFGVDNWEYTLKQTRVCSKLAKKFDAISVREESGVKLCEEHLGIKATWVLDPTLLLTKEDYLLICEEVPVCEKKYLAVYVLDENEEVTVAYEKEAANRELVIKKFHADSKSTLTVPEWLAMFRDASYIVTDSFHGTVFSIIFGKEFKCIYNHGRGAARFESLMSLYNSGKIEEMREFSLNWLENAGVK